MQNATERYVALLRGINVGKAKPVAMGTLARVFETLGYTAVKTWLRSGNVVFDATEKPEPQALERALLDATGVHADMLIVTHEEFLVVASIAQSAADGSHFFITFVNTMPDEPEIVDAALLAPETLQVGPGAIYQWLPAGYQGSRVPKTFWAQFGTPITTRNANTVRKIAGMLEAPRRSDLADAVVVEI